MGGREVGGLANMLAAHLGYSAGERDVVRRFWDAPDLARSPGLKAVAMFTAVAAGQIKALWVIGSNPAVSLPRADHVRAAMRKLELLVVSDNVVANDTVQLAHIRLPAAGWGEKDGTVTNSERRISRQRAFLSPPGDARPDWWIISQVAQRLGWTAAFAYRSAADIFREHAALSGFENKGRRVFDISALSRLTDAAYDGLTPVQWPLTEHAKGTERLFADGGFAAASGRARLIAVAPGRPAHAVSARRPFVLNTGRVRDQWHTMTRTGRSPRLAAHISAPFVEINPDDAEALGLAQGTLARVSTRYGSAALRVTLSDGQRPGSLFAPIHWSAANSSRGRIGALVQPATDPLSGQPEAKATPARIDPLPMTHFGFLLSRQPVATDAMAYWAASRIEAGHATNFALAAPPASWSDWCGGLLRTASASAMRTRLRNNSAWPCCAMHGSKQSSTSPNRWR
jgi:assimilatory nitrate reductase catalytic subunit